MWWWVLACTTAPGESQPLPAPEPEPEPPAVVTSVEAEPTWDPLARSLEVTLAEAGPVVVGCVDPADPVERHLVESTAPSTHHTLHLGGLLPDTTYTCAAAATAVDGPPLGFEIRTEPLDGIVPEAVVQGAPTEAGFLLTVYKPDACSLTSWLLILDPQGRVRWRHPLPDGTLVDVQAQLHDGVVAWGGGQRVDGAGLVDLVEGETYRLNLPEAHPVHHDTRLLDDGTLLTLEHRTIDAPSGSFAGFGLRRHEPATGEVLWSYDSSRAAIDGDLPTGFLDPWHANWIDRLPGAPGGPQVVVSLCFTFQLVAIDEATGAIAWIAGPDGDLDLTTGRWPECQHGPELDDTRLLTYDNGLLTGESSIVEYALDHDNGTASELWRWTEPGWFEETLGDVDRLPWGHVLVTRAHPECWSLGSPGAHSELLELDPTTGDVPWRLTFSEVQDTVYRAEWIDPCAVFSHASQCPSISDGWALQAHRLGL